MNCKEMNEFYDLIIGGDKYDQAKALIEGAKEMFDVSDDANMYPGWRFENVATLVPFEGRGGVGRGNARKLRGESK